MGRGPGPGHQHRSQAPANPFPDAGPPPWEEAAWELSREVFPLFLALSLILGRRWETNLISFLFWAISTHSARQGLGAVGRGREGPQKGEGIWTWLPPSLSWPRTHPREETSPERTLSVPKGSEAEKQSVALGVGVTRESTALTWG